MKLYELSDEYRKTLQQLQDLDLPPESVMDTVDAMQGELTEKIRAVVAVAMEMLALAITRKEHAKRMAESAKALESRADSLLSYAQITIQTCGLATPLDFPEFSVSLHKNPPSVQVDDLTVVPSLYKQHTVTLSIDGEVAAKAGKALDDVIKSAVAEGHLPSLSGFTVEEKVDKKSLLTALKAGAVSGAHINPTSYRVAVK